MPVPATSSLGDNKSFCFLAQQIFLKQTNNNTAQDTFVFTIAENNGIFKESSVAVVAVGNMQALCNCALEIFLLAKVGKRCKTISICPPQSLATTVLLCASVKLDV